MQAIGIFSGGLDSLIATKLMLEQNLKVTLLTFTSPFFTPEKALKASLNLNLKPLLCDLTLDMIPLLINPPHGHGRWLNPCIDCHALMFKKAGDFLQSSGEKGFLFSGEVLGQRPMSQNKNSLKLVAKNSGYEDLILRPLSALLLEPTPMEKEGLINREQLLDISGRSRQRQFNLAKKYSFIDYPTPGGGCLLTDSGYTNRLKWLIILSEKNSDNFLTERNMRLIKLGRIFKAQNKSLVVVGRNKSENQALVSLADDSQDLLLNLDKEPGPMVLLVNWQNNEELYELAAKLCVSYAPVSNKSDFKMVKSVNNLAIKDEKFPMLSRDDFLSFLL